MEWPLSANMSLVPLFPWFFAQAVFLFFFHLWPYCSFIFIAFFFVNHIIMARSRSAAAKARRGIARREARKARKARTAESANSVKSAKKSKSSKPSPLRSLLGKADDQPLSTLNCPRPETAPKTASKTTSKIAAKVAAKSTTKKKKSQKIKKLAPSLNPLEKVSFSRFSAIYLILT